MVIRRTLLAAACALGLSAAATATASAAVPRPLPDPSEIRPSSIQVWTEKGLHHVIDCPTLTADPACDAREYPHNFAPLLERYGGWRALSRKGNWYEDAAYDKVWQEIDRADEFGLPGAAKMETDPYALELIVGRTDP